ncbi:MAG: hypothetical protein HGB26_06210 [Desulfobulbaceae bacterium]|nr:hypothetical protein [Desulfobulbaceae bacterium]
MKTADELFDGSNARLLDDSAVHPSGYAKLPQIEGSTFLAAAELIKKLATENEQLAQNVCDECSPDNYGWVFNRVEGKAACVCMTEAEPFQILLSALEKITRVESGDYSRAKGIAVEALRAVLPLDYTE